MTTRSAEAASPHRAGDLAVFRSTEAWIFDLDNTLYPRATNLFAQVDERIRAYVRKLLDVDEAEADRLQKQYYREYGTTLRGLMLTRDIDPDEFLEFVHDIDHTTVPADPALCEAILRLPGKKYIFTNGSRKHAEAIASRLGFTKHFEDIFDIVAANLVPKPERQTYDRFVARFGVAAEKAAMFEDLTRNLVVPKEVGMTTVLVVPSGTREVFTGEWEYEGRDDDHVDFVTDDLASFIRQVADAIGA